MTEHILVGVAWPYANSEIHVGNITGSYLPADIFARYQRLGGNQVLMVSGSDSHGTPVTVRADAEGTTPVAVYQRFHARFIELFQKLGLSYDLFTSTHTDNHFEVSQKIFLALQKNGYLYTERQQQWYAPTQNRFLPDRYVEGTCYICGYTNARGDQCDNCGSLLDAAQLINPRSKIDGSTPELRETEHFYLDLGKLQPEIGEFLRQRGELLASQCAAPVAGSDASRCAARARHHPRPGLGHSGAGGRLGGEMPVRLVRGGDRLPFRRHRMGALKGSPMPGTTGGPTRKMRHITLSARITSPSMPSSGRRS